MMGKDVKRLQELINNLEKLKKEEEKKEQENKTEETPINENTIIENKEEV